MDRYFTREDIQMANEYVKRCSMSFAVRDMQIKITVTYHYTPIRITKTKWPNACKVVEKLHRPYTAGGTYGKQFVSYKSKHATTNDSWILEHLPQRNENLWLATWWLCREAHILVRRICEYGTLYCKRVFAVVIKLMILTWRDYFGWFKWAQYNQKGLYKREAEGPESEDLVMLEATLGMPPWAKERQPTLERKAGIRFAPRISRRNSDFFFFLAMPHGMRNFPDQGSNPCPLHWKLQES